MSRGVGATVLSNVFAERIVNAGLIAFALPAKPGDDVCVEAHGELLFDGPIEGVRDGVAPGLFRKLRNVG